MYMVENECRCILARSVPVWYLETEDLTTMKRKFPFSQTALERLLREAAGLSGDTRTEHQDAHPTGLWGRAYGPSRQTQGQAVIKFVLPYRFGGKQRRLTLQPAFPALEYSTAVQLAHEALAQLAKGVDPGAERREQKQAQIAEAQQAENTVLIETAVPDFIERYMRRGGNRPKVPHYIRNVERQLERFAVAHWRGRSITSITKQDILDVLNEIMEEDHGTTANRVWAALSKFFTWSMEQGIGGLAISPMTGIKKPSYESEREHKLSATELRVVWRAAQRLPFPYWQYFRLLIVAGQRRTQTAKLRWDALTDEDWTMMASGTKNKKHQHLVPISPLMADILAECHEQRTGKFVFPGRFKDSAINNFDEMKQQLDAAVIDYCAETGEPVPEPWIIHDLRRTFASGLGPLGVTRFIIERLLNHSDGSVTGRHYDLYEYRAEKAEALAKWSNWLARLVADDPDQVVKIALKSNAPI
jgi:integrase